MKRLGCFLLLCGLLWCFAACDLATPLTGGNTASLDSFHLVMSEDNRDLEPMLTAYVEAMETAPHLEITYAGIADITRALESSECPYDAVWISSSVTLQMLEGGQSITSSRFTSASPVVFAVKESKARELAFPEDLMMSDIVAAVKAGKLTFVMPSVTQTNSGLSAYLGILSALSGNPKVLTADLLENPELEAELTSLFAGVERSSGSDAFVIELAETGEYDCIVAAENTVIQLNRTLEAGGKEPMRLLYPRDGVTIADAPLAYVDQGNAAKKEFFLALQSHVLSPEGQEALAQLGRRTDLGGLIDASHDDIFRADWGIPQDTYIQTIVYPAKAFIRKAMSQYQDLFRKPAVTVFCLDFSGSMYGDGHFQLMEAMEYILDPAQAGREFIQFAEKDRVVVLPFSSRVLGVLEDSGDQGPWLLAAINTYEPNGGTSMYRALLRAQELIAGMNTEGAIVSIVLMTDGESDLYQQENLLEGYSYKGWQVPIYSIMFGDANPEQLEILAEVTRGKVFDGREDLMSAFREVRGYN